jgi:hypothetical protein
VSIGQTREQALYSCATPEGITEYNDKLNFTSRNIICTDPEVVKYININFHFIQDGNGRGNFRINDDGQGNSNYTGYDRAKDYVNYMNIKFQSNAVMKLPCVDDTPTTAGKVGVVQPSILEEVHSVKQVVEDNPKNTSILSTNNELRLSPNPANEYLNIEFDVEINETFELTLWNSLGEQVSIIRKGIAIQTQELQITFDILEFPSGNYFVTLQTSKRKITKQLIIAK